MRGYEPFSVIHDGVGSPNLLLSVFVFLVDIDVPSHHLRQ